MGAEDRGARWAGREEEAEGEGGEGVSVRVKTGRPLDT